MEICPSDPSPGPQGGAGRSCCHQLVIWGKPSPSFVEILLQPSRICSRSICMSSIYFPSQGPKVLGLIRWLRDQSQRFSTGFWQWNSCWIYHGFWLLDPHVWVVNWVKSAIVSDRWNPFISGCHTAIRVGNTPKFTHYLNCFGCLFGELTILVSIRAASSISKFVYLFHVGSTNHSTKHLVRKKC